MHAPTTARSLLLLLALVVTTWSCTKSDPVNPVHPDRTGSIAIEVDPAYLQASWTLVDPEGNRRSGAGSTTLESVAVGTHTLQWNDLTGWQCPSDQTVSVSQQSRTRVTGTFVPTGRGSIAISYSPSTAAVEWALSGPGGFQSAGTSPTTVDGLVEGTYTVLWEAGPGWMLDGPATTSETLTTGGSASFHGAFIQVTTSGSIAIDVTPDSIDAPWTLTGPGAFARDGNGDEVVGDLAAGSYTLTWRSVSGWQLPSPSQTTVQVDGGAVSIQGTYTQPPTVPGAIVIDAIPDTISPPWSLDGPGSYREEGNGDATLTNLVDGGYTLTWYPYDGWRMPYPQQSYVTVNGDTQTITGEYTEITFDGTTDPSASAAPSNHAPSPDPEANPDPTGRQP